MNQYQTPNLLTKFG